jgi:hypothetical protein
MLELHLFFDRGSTDVRANNLFIFIVKFKGLTLTKNRKHQTSVH